MTRGAGVVYAKPLDRVGERSGALRRCAVGPRVCGAAVGQAAFGLVAVGSATVGLAAATSVCRAAVSVFIRNGAIGTTISPLLIEDDYPTPESADDIPFEQYDFISNALHELGHVLGFMASNAAFESSIEEGIFVGPTAQSLYGGPVPLTEELGHFPSGTVLDDGVEALMDSGQANGARFLPTPLDLADIGYEIAP